MTRAIVTLQNALITAGILHFLAQESERFENEQRKCLLAMAIETGLYFYDRFTQTREIDVRAVAAARAEVGATAAAGEPIETDNVAGGDEYRLLIDSESAADAAGSSHVIQVETHESLPIYIELLITHVENLAIIAHYTNHDNLKLKPSGRFAVISNDIRFAIGHFLKPTELTSITSMNHYERANRHYWLGSLFKPANLSLMRQLDELKLLIQEIETIQNSYQAFVRNWNYAPVNSRDEIYSCLLFCAFRGGPLMTFLSFSLAFSPAGNDYSLVLILIGIIGAVASLISSGSLAIHALHHRTSVNFMTSPLFSSGIKQRCFDLLTNEQISIQDCTIVEVMQHLQILQTRLAEVQRYQAIKPSSTKPVQIDEQDTPPAAATGNENIYDRSEEMPTGPADPNAYQLSLMKRGL